MMIRLFVLALVLVGLGGCASSPKTVGHTVDGLAFENATRDEVHEARLVVPATGGMVACGYIPRGASCSTTFPVREYQGNAIVLSWQQAGRQWETRPMVLPVPDVPAGTRLRAVVTFLGAGDFEARLVPLGR